MNLPVLRPAVFFIALAVLSGCGFQLAGTRPLPEPLKTVFIQMDSPYRVDEPPLQTALRRELGRRGAKVEARAENALTHIRLSQLREQRETLSIGSDGKALEYRLVLSVHYEVRRGTQTLVPGNELTVRRDYSFSADQILAKEAEENQLREYIQTEMAELLMLRIDAVLAGAVAG